MAQRIQKSSNRNGCGKVLGSYRPVSVLLQAEVQGARDAGDGWVGEWVGVNALLARTVRCWSQEEW